MIKINTCHITEDGLEVSGTEPSAMLELDGSGNPPVRACGEIHYDLRAMMAGRDLVVMGSASVPLETECVRCLSVIHPVLRVPSVCLHFEKVADQEVDITDNIREDLLLALPQNFHCSESCRGLCPGCGADLNHETCRCSELPPEAPVPGDESPWAALDGLKSGQKTK